MRLYGIKTCGSVRKAIKFFKENDIEFEFIDIKKEEIKQEKIDAWLQKVSIDKLFNNKGTKYRTLKLKDLNLNDDEKAKWLAKENMLIKRPVIEYRDKVIVAFNEEEYRSLFL